MKSKQPFSAIEIIFIIIIILVVISMMIPFLNVTHSHSGHTRDMAQAKSLGLTLIAYAEDDVRAFKMPYPLPKGKEKVWGNSKDCWSTTVAEMLFEQKYMKKGEESQLKSRGSYSAEYKPMYLNDNTPQLNRFWNEKSELDFHIYCDKELTSNIPDKTVLVATYDNETIANCQYGGKGWVIFYSDKTVEFIKRKRYFEIKYEKEINPNIKLETDEPYLSDNGIILRKNIPASEGGPGTFGNFLGGGSTELMGKKESDPIYKALVR